MDTLDPSPNEASVLGQKFVDQFSFVLSLSKGEILCRSCFDGLSTNGEIVLQISDTGY